MFEGVLGTRQSSSYCRIDMSLLQISVSLYKQQNNIDSRDNMVSNTNRTETIRERKRRRSGRKRKNNLENHGTTPSQKALFAVKKDTDK